MTEQTQTETASAGASETGASALRNDILTRPKLSVAPARPIFDRPAAAPAATPLKALLDERQKTHGDFAATAVVAQAIKVALRAGPNWTTMTPPQRETLENIATKTARIVCGDPNFDDHWIDIAGWAQKAAEAMTS